MNLEKTVYLFIEVIENKVINIITLCDETEQAIRFSDKQRPSNEKIPSQSSTGRDKEIWFQKRKMGAIPENTPDFNLCGDMESACQNMCLSISSPDSHNLRTG